MGGKYRRKPNGPENERSSRCFGLRSYPVNIAYCIIQVLRCTVLYQTGLYKRGNIQIIVGDTACDNLCPGSGPTSELSAGLGGGDLAWPGLGHDDQSNTLTTYSMQPAACWMVNVWLVVILSGVFGSVFFSATESCCWGKSSWNALHIWSKKCCHDVVVKVVAPWFSCKAPCHHGSRLPHHVLFPSAWRKLLTSRGVR